MANTKEIKRIIESNKSNIAFIIGNGINRYPNNPKALSWDDLLMELWNKISFQTLSKKPQGISITEFYDILELENTGNYNLQKEVVKLLRSWEPQTHHKQISDYIKSINAPLLTTNFEETFAKTGNYKLYRIEEEKGFTDFYPWTSYHGDNQLELPTDGFGIWYINGMINYHRSIRLGLSHYMGSVERTRGLLHKGNEDSLFSGKNVGHWPGSKSWLHIVFNKSLFIFGIGLEENEIFLRWLLIERTKYFRKFPDRKQKGWYLTPKYSNDIDLGKKFFLEKVGIEVLEVDCFDDIYGKIWTKS